MPPPKVNSIVINRDSLNNVDGEETSAIKIEGSPMLAGIKKENTSNGFRKEMYFTAADPIKKENRFQSEDFPMYEYSPKVDRDKENNLISPASLIVDFHTSVFEVKEEVQFVNEDSSETYFSGEETLALVKEEVHIADEESMETCFSGEEIHDPLALQNIKTELIRQSTSNPQGRSTLHFDDPHEFQNFRNSQQTNLGFEGQNHETCKMVNQFRSLPKQLNEVIATGDAEHNFQFRSMERISESIPWQGKNEKDEKENYDGNNVVGTKSEPNLKNPSSVHSSKELMSCPFCPIKFSVNKRTQYSMHLRTHGESPLFCPICPKEFKLQQNLVCHVRCEHLRISKNQDYQCDSCEAVFGCSLDLAAHFRSLHVDQYFFRAMCKFCLSTLEQDRYLKRLLLIVQNGENNESSSEVSQSNNAHFENKSVFAACPLQNSQNDCILKDSLANFNISCFSCPAKFTERSSFAKHLTAHSLNKTYQCPDCPEIYKTELEFYSHWKHHKGELAYSCNFCPSRFAQCCESIKHVKTVHSDLYWSFDKNTVRAQNSEQSSQSVAQNHKTSTSLAVLSPKPNISEDSESELLHPCKFCTEKFYYRNDLARHITRRHKVNCHPVISEEKSGHTPNSNAVAQTKFDSYTTAQPYLCPFCSSRFPNRWDFIEHLKALHAHKLCPSSGKQSSGSGKNGVQNEKNQLSAPTNLIQNSIIQEVTYKGSHLCQFCATRYLHLRDLMRHLKVFHSNELSLTIRPNGNIELMFNVPQEFEESSLSDKLYSCAFCYAKFLNSSLLMKHFTSQHPEKYLDPGLFVRGSERKNRQHLLSATTLTDLKFKCPECPAEFIWMISVINHMKAHDLKVIKFK